MNKLTTRSRRLFLKDVSLFAVALPALDLSMLACTTPLAKSLAVENPENIPWKITTVSPTEPGEPLVVGGKIYAPDGKSPLAGISLFVYQTDSTGVYSVNNNGDNRATRIHGRMKSDAAGRYEFHTIKPGSYPGGRTPAHIHAYVSGPGYPEYWIDDYLFSDDEFISASDRAKNGSLGSFSAILTLTRDASGVWHGVRDLKLERCSRTCTRR